MKTVTFTYEKPESVVDPSYHCSEPGDRSGEYVKAEDASAILDVVRRLARLRTGPRESDRAAWIEKVLALAEDARAATAK